MLALIGLNLIALPPLGNIKSTQTQRYQENTRKLTSFTPSFKTPVIEGSPEGSFVSLNCYLNGGALRGPCMYLAGVRCFLSRVKSLVILLKAKLDPLRLGSGLVFQPGMVCNPF